MLKIAPERKKEKERMSKLIEEIYMKWKNVSRFLYSWFELLDCFCLGDLYKKIVKRDCLGV